MTTERIDVLAVLDGAIEEYTSPRFTDRHGTGPELTKARAAIAEFIAATSSLLDNLEAWNEAPATGFPQHDFTRVCRALARVGAP